MFTKENLVQMKNECVSELEALGYEMLPIVDISFSKRLSTSYGICRARSGCIRNRKTREFENIGLVIVIDYAMSLLDENWQDQLKLLVMHECIHAVKTDEYPYEIVVRHGPEYDSIAKNVEAAYWYKGINDDNYYHFENVLPEIRQKIQKEKERH